MTEDWKWAREYVKDLTTEDIQNTDIMDFLKAEMRNEIIRKVPRAGEAGVGIWTIQLDYQIEYNNYILVVEWHE